MLSENVTDYKCKRCNKEFSTQDELKYHVSTEEHLTEQGYFDMLIRPHFAKEGRCLTCGMPTKFINLSVGYEDYCSRHKK